MTVVVAVVVPVFVGIFEEISLGNTAPSSSLPIPTQITVARVRRRDQDQWYIIIPILVGLTYAFVRWKKTERGRFQWDRFKLKLPAKVGDVVQKVALARWARTFSGTVASGVPILQAVEISGETAGNAVIEDAMEDVYASVKRGGSIAGPLRENQVFPPMVSHMVAVGEESGQLETDAGEDRRLLRGRGRREGQGADLADRADHDHLSSAAWSASSSSRCTCRSSASTTRSARPPRPVGDRLRPTRRRRQT